IVAAGRVSAALAAAEAARFDLLISNIELPDGTGLELMHRLGGGRTLPGIAISGLGSEEDLRDSAHAGFAEHLIKPIDLKCLESVIRRLAQRGQVLVQQGQVPTRNAPDEPKDSISGPSKKLGWQT